MATPIIKWVGGKTKLLPELVARAPATYDRYFEPFAGGAALFFRLAPARAVLNDFNADLVGVYRSVRDGADDLIARLERHAAAHGVDHYYATRDWWNTARSPTADGAERAAAFIYLNKTCFNGLWRVNRAGYFNVPMGSYKNPPICVPDTLRAAASALARERVDLRCGDYRTAVADAAAGDFLYFDPPYVPVTPTASFTSYTADGFGLEQQRELAAAARALVARGCRVMLSNSDTPLVRSLYDGFRVDGVECARAINSDAKKRGKVGEVIVVGGY